MPARFSKLFVEYGLYIAILAGLAAFLLYPIGLTVRGGFASDPATGSGFTLEHIRMVFADPVLVEGLVNAFAIAVWTTTLSIVVALPLAILSANFKFPGKTLLNACVLVPLILPPFVGAIGAHALLGRAGSLNSLLGTEFDFFGSARFWGVVIVQALHLYPIIYLNATASLANLDPALDESAENLGAGPIRRFFKITLPLIRPGLFAGATIVFIWAFTELGTPLMFDFTTVTPVQIFYGLKEVENSAEPYALTVVLLIAAVLLYLVGKGLFGKRGYAMYAKASRAGGEIALPWWGGLLATGFFAGVTILAVLPHFGVVLTALTEPGQWYKTVLPTSLTLDNFDQALTHPDAFGSIRNSLQLAGIAMILDIAVGLMIGYLLVRSRVRGKAVLDALSMLPLAVPGLVMAFGYVAMTLRWPFGGDLTIFGVTIPAFLDGTIFDLEVFGAAPNPFPLLIIAYAVRRLPYIVRSTVAGLEQTSGELEEAALNLGANRVTAIRKIIVPLIMANLIAGGLLVFSFSMLEVSDSLILAQQELHYPITKRIFAFTMRLGDGPFIASAMGVWGMTLLALTLFGASLLLGKKLGAIFRV